MAKQLNQETLDELKEMHRGLHQAMDELINRQNFTQSEILLRQVDLRMVDLINAVSRQLGTPAAA